MTDDTDFRFAVAGEDKFSSVFRKAEAQGRRTGKAFEDSTRSMARYADQAKSRFETMLGPARALAPEIDRVAGPIGRVLKAGQALGAAFAADKPARAGKAFRDTARAAGDVGAAFKGAGAGIVAANDNLGAAATAADAAGEGMAAAGAEAATAGAGFATLAAGAGGLATGLVAIGAAAVGAEVAMAKFASPFATRAQQLQNMADSIGLVTQRLEAFQGAGERVGVSKEATAGSLAGLAATIHNAQYGLDANSIAATRLAGINPGARGSRIDVSAAAVQAADAIAAQKSPQAQARLASLLGISPEALPLFRKGGAALKAQMSAFASTGDVTSDAQKQALIAQRVAQTNFNQAADAKAKALAVAAAKHNTGVLNSTAGALSGAGGTPTVGQVGGRALGAMFPGLSLSAAIGRGALRSLGGASPAAAGPGGAAHAVQGAANAVRDFGQDAWDMMAGIIRQESGGHQAGRGGHVLTSNKGAVGAGQLLPDTARRAAAFAGIRWDPKRFYDPNDKAYSLQLAHAELQRLLSEFNGDKVLASAAYNAGEGRLTGGKGRPGWLQTIGDPRKGEVSDLDFARRIPFAETRDYVLRTQFGATEAQARARGGALEAAATQKVEGEILVKVDAPPGTKVITNQAGPVRLKVQRTDAFLNPFLGG